MPCPEMMSSFTVSISELLYIFVPILNRLFDNHSVGDGCVAACDSVLNGHSALGTTGPHL